jgi:hypothetical protein
MSLAGHEEGDVNPVHLVLGVLASGIAALTVIATQGMTGRETTSSLFLWYSGGWFLLFGLAASLPTLLRATQRQRVGRAFLAFGAGGAVAGALTALLFVTHQLGGSPAAVLVAFAIPVLLPWGLGALIMSQTGKRAVRAQR